MRTNANLAGPTPLRLLALVALCLLGGCASDKQGHDPMAVVRDPGASEARRSAAIDQAWSRVAAGEAARDSARSDLKALIWSQSWPVGLRIKALGVLLDDSDPAGAADARGMARLMLPRESNLQMIAFLSDTAATRGWNEMTPALVRSLSRTAEGIPDEERAEYRAIARLNPDRTVPEVAFGVFLNPPEDVPAFGGLTTVSPGERARADAWDVMARLDRDGSIRSRLLDDARAEAPEILADLRACAEDLRVMPQTGEELRWMASLRHTRNGASAQWWEEARAAIARVGTDRAPRLDLRHAEAIRWAAASRPEWLGATREELLSTLGDRLSGRDGHRRSAREGSGERPPAEGLQDWADRLTWADVLVLLVVDDALAGPEIARAVFAQAEMDRKDRTAEYGGLLTAQEAAFATLLYPPRPATRRGDREFAASPDMMAQGDRALAHYHFHAQTPRNGAYAGPSTGDLDYAARTGRTCIVFTSVGEDLIGVDVYQPDRVVIDLGEIERAR